MKLPPWSTQFESEPHPLADGAMRPHVGRGINLRAGRDDGRRVKPGRQDWLRKKRLQRPGERQARIGHADENLFAGRAGFVRDDGGGRALLGGGEIFGVFRKRQVAGLRGVGRGKAGQHRVAVAQDLAVQPPRNFCYGKTHWIDLSVGAHYKALQV